MPFAKSIRTSIFSLLSGIGALIVTAVATAPAANAATIRTCTNANQIVNVAIAFPTGPQEFTLQGWWRIPANGCINLPATPENATHYFFAYTQNRDYVWPTATGPKFCLNNLKYTYTDWKQSMPCPEGSELRFFWPMTPVGGVINIEFNY